ncbi:MAG: hypothetical protein M0R34_07000 [Candidatus Marinimicrobia bacterium]|jgi:hypothetical protein|nr:hypothetical protein [Candidatus Neomarinimicrobiota bacterium]
MDSILITSFVAIIIALIALIFSFRAIRFQIISLLNSQLAYKARDCNSNLDSNDLSKMPIKNDKVSWIVSSIITAEEIIFYQKFHKKNVFIRVSDIQSLIDHFYLQLHTTIRVFLKKEIFKEDELSDIIQYEDIKNQYFRCVKFLSCSLQKDKEYKFEEFHKYTEIINKQKCT